MLHRIRLAMRHESNGQMFGFGGPVESDETYIGPNPAKMHKEAQGACMQSARWTQGRNGAGETARTPEMLDRELRRVRAKSVVPNVKREDHCRMPILKARDSVCKGLHPAKFSGYDDLKSKFVLQGR